MDGLNKVVITILCVRCEAHACSVSERPAVCRSVPAYALYNTLSNRLLGQQQVGNYEDRYLSRGTIARLRGLSIGIVSNNRVRAVTTIAYCATDMLAKVYMDWYFRHQHDLKMTPNRLPFEQYLFIATNRYLLVMAIGLR